MQTGLFLLPIYAACAPVEVKRSRVASEQLVFTCAGGAGPATLAVDSDRLLTGFTSINMPTLELV